MEGKEEEKEKGGAVRGRLVRGLMGRWVSYWWESGEVLLFCVV